MKYCSLGRFTLLAVGVSKLKKNELKEKIKEKKVLLQHVTKNC
jgi:hypothetical protein